MGDITKGNQVDSINVSRTEATDSSRKALKGMHQQTQNFVAAMLTSMNVAAAMNMVSGLDSNQFTKLDSTIAMSSPENSQSTPSKGVNVNVGMHV